MEEDKDRLNIWIPKQLKRRIKIYAAKADMTIREVIIEAVEDRLKKEKSLT